MKKFAISLAAGASALFATAAFAAPLSNGMTTLPDGNVEQVRMVCNETGRCWRERGQRRVIIRDSYGYAPANAISTAAVTRTVAALASARRE
jgi:hypothetical protein